MNTTIEEETGWQVKVGIDTEFSWVVLAILDRDEAGMEIALNFDEAYELKQALDDALAQLERDM